MLGAMYTCIWVFAHASCWVQHPETILCFGVSRWAGQTLLAHGDAWSFQLRYERAQNFCLNHFRAELGV